MKYIQFFSKRVVERTKDVPYLIRWNLFSLGINSSIFSIKVHKILLSDDDCLHDHPWDFVSIILKGGYTEWRFAGNDKDLIKAADVCKYDNSQWTIGYKYKPGQLLYREANFAHRLEIEPTKPCWTLVFTFKKVKKWGFFTKSGWKYYRDYSKDEHC